MAARVITFTSGKGGVGKTTCVSNIGVALAMQGQRVVLIDADVGLRNLDVNLGLENRIVFDLVDVIEGRCRLRQSLIRDKRLPELLLMPAAQTRDKDAVTVEAMIDICERLRDQHDFVLIDSPAGIEQGFRYALAPADEVVVVTNLEVAAIRDADRVIGLLEADEKGPAQLIINRVRPEMIRRGEMLEVSDVVELLAIDLVGIIPEDPAVLGAANRGQPLALVPDGSLAGQAFHNTAQRVLGQDVPFQTPREPGVLRRLFRFVRSQEGQ
jgi:septum site-determining protein MinD